MALPLHSGQILDGKYEVGGAIGQGAMGLVFAARHLLLNRPVAIKVLRPELSHSEELRARFAAEARAAAAIGHPNIVAVTDMGRTPEGALYFVMDRLTGETLAQRLRRRGTLLVGEAVAIAVEVLDGLEAAHALGVIHRDLKPDNLFLCAVPGGREMVRILDFGVARAALAATQPGATQAGLLLGTPEYMAPEQARGAADLDSRVDLYAVGVVLYRMLSGQLPYSGSNPLEVLAALQTGPPPVPLGRRCPHLPAGLVQAVEAAMARDRTDRPPTARALRDWLLPFLPAPSPTQAGPAAADATVQRLNSPASRREPTGPPIEPATEFCTHRGPPLSTPPPGAPPPPAAPFGPAAALRRILHSARSLAGMLGELRRRAAAPLAAQRSEPPGPSGEPAAAEDSRRDELPDPERPEMGLSLSPFAAAGRPRFTPSSTLGLLLGVGLVGSVLWLGWERAAPWLIGLSAPDRTAGSSAEPAVYRPLPRDDAVLIQVRVTPRRSRLLLDGEPVQSNPLRLPRGHGEHELTAEADGFEPQVLRFRPDRAQTLTIRLRRKR